MQIYARDHVELTFNLNHCDAAITFIKSLKLPPLCDHILQATDAGPGVGVTNIEVKYRDIEMPRINSWTVTWTGFTAHPHDSGQNEAERSNAAICEALVDGRALHWEYFQPTDLISEEELKTLTVEEMKQLEAEVVQRIAWRVAQDFVSRIDGELGPTGDCMKAFVTNRKEQQFFFNTEYIQQYNAAKSETRKVKVPGHNYFKKLDDFIESCMTTGEIFHEYCENESVDPTPRPVPDINKPPKYHYLPVAETPITNTDGSKRREVDDYHPSPQKEWNQYRGSFATDKLLKKVLWKNT